MLSPWFSGLNIPAPLFLNSWTSETVPKPFHFFFFIPSLLFWVFDFPPPPHLSCPPFPFQVQAIKNSLVRAVFQCSTPFPAAACESLGASWPTSLKGLCEGEGHTIPFSPQWEVSKQNSLHLAIAGGKTATFKTEHIFFFSLSSKIWDIPMAMVLWVVLLFPSPHHHPPLPLPCCALGL